MTNDTKVRFTLRIKKEVIDEVERRANSLGLNKNAYITMVLHKELAKKVG